MTFESSAHREEEEVLTGFDCGADAGLQALRVAVVLAHTSFSQVSIGRRGGPATRPVTFRTVR